MQFNAVLLPPRRAASIAGGFWHDRTIHDDLDACIARCPNKTAVTAVRADSGEVLMAPPMAHPTGFM
jgi:cyclohexanecarboxylate-CoA ligase